MRTLLCWLLAGGLLTAACGDGEDEPPGRGTPACQDFQDAICDHAVDRCGGLNRATCDQTFKGIECKSDDAASACTNGLNNATCGQPVSGCDLAQIIDPQPAIARCEAFLDAACDHFMKCGRVADRAACEAATSATVDCARAVSANLSYERCIEQLDGTSCSASLPSVCEGTIGILPPGVLGFM
jgi:hypothetical protein